MYNILNMGKKFKKIYSKYQLLHQNINVTEINAHRHRTAAVNLIFGGSDNNKYLH